MSTRFSCSLPLDSISTCFSINSVNQLSFYLPFINGRPPETTFLLFQRKLHRHILQKDKSRLYPPPPPPFCCNKSHCFELTTAKLKPTEKIREKQIDPAKKRRGELPLLFWGMSSNDEDVQVAVTCSVTFGGYGVIIALTGIFTFVDFHYMTRKKKREEEKLLRDNDGDLEEALVLQEGFFFFFFLLSPFPHLFLSVFAHETRQTMRGKVRNALNYSSEGFLWNVLQIFLTSPLLSSLPFSTSFL